MALYLAVSLQHFVMNYYNNPYYWDRQGCANNADLDKMPENWHLIRVYTVTVFHSSSNTLDTSTGSTMDSFKF